MQRKYALPPTILMGNKYKSHVPSMQDFFLPEFGSTWFGRWHRELLNVCQIQM